MNETEIHLNIQKIREAHFSLEIAKQKLIEALRGHEDFHGDRQDAEFMAALIIEICSTENKVLAVAIKQYLCTSGYAPVITNLREVE